ncbi:hypothetical protein FZEAL_7379 [Fusarium zealandicum]|uniref:F-box domain-containing protein n=1 Tax=Fusarium zealandicum TaxID=1053134 RepID=A0A8H4XIJ4_9HYPO|nr:hypothetical protein FZEAL_7379 [Fusarium zealandicum]
MQGVILASTLPRLDNSYALFTLDFFPHLCLALITSREVGCDPPRTEQDMKQPLPRLRSLRACLKRTRKSKRQHQPDDSDPQVLDLIRILSAEPITNSQAWYALEPDVFLSTLSCPSLEGDTQTLDSPTTDSQSWYALSRKTTLNSLMIPSPRSESQPLETRDPLSYSSREQSHDSPNQSVGLINLPYEIFLDVFKLLPISEAIRCRRVCKALRQALTGQILCASLILEYFPFAREGRILRSWITEQPCPEAEGNDHESTDWAAVFAQLARRYWHLSQATPWKTIKIKTRKGQEGLHGMLPWHRFLSSSDETASFHYWDPLWTISSEDGLIVYLDPGGSPQEPLQFCAQDIETGEVYPVPFHLSHGLIIRIHLNEGVLLFTLMLPTAQGHQIFIEAFDVIRRRPATFLPRHDDKDGGRSSERTGNPDKQPYQAAWAFSSRGRFQLGRMPQLSSHNDRIFCAHNNTHFTLYSWTLNYEAGWIADPPEEELTVWDIRVSPDQGLSQNTDATSSNNSTPKKPGCIMRLANNDLDALGLRQQFTPRFRGMEIDKTTWDPQTRSPCGRFYVIEDNHHALAGPHGGNQSISGHHVTRTGYPLAKDGLLRQESCSGSTFTIRESHVADALSRDHSSVFRCTRHGLGTSQCWRHNSFPFITISRGHDAAASVEFAAHQHFACKAISVSVPAGLYGQRSALTVQGSDSRYDREERFLEKGMWDSLMGKGHICGDERWLVGEDGDGDITILRF